MSKQTRFGALATAIGSAPARRVLESAVRSPARTEGTAGLVSAERALECAHARLVPRRTLMRGMVMIKASRAYDVFDEGQAHVGPFGSLGALPGVSRCTRRSPQGQAPLVPSLRSAGCACN